MPDATPTTAVTRVRGLMNQPVPIHCELSAAVISNEAVTRQGNLEVLRSAE